MLDYQKKCHIIIFLVLRLNTDMLFIHHFMQSFYKVCQLLPSPMAHYENTDVGPELHLCSFPVWIPLTYKVLQERGLITVHALTHKGGPCIPAFQTPNAPKCHVVSTESCKSEPLCLLPGGSPPTTTTIPLLTADRSAVCPSLINKISILLAGTQPAHTRCLWMLTTTSASKPFSMATIALRAEWGSAVSISAHFICKTPTTKKTLIERSN